MKASLFTCSSMIVFTFALVLALADCTLAGPDLYADLLLIRRKSGPDFYIASDQIKLLTEVENIGDQVSDSYTVSYYASSDGTITADDYYLGSTTRSGLAPDSDSVFEPVYPIPEGIPDGHYAIGMIVECSNDTVLDNNVRRASGGIRVHVPVADLTVRTVDALGRCCRPGEPLNVITTIENTGLKASSSYSIDFYIGDHFIGNAGRGSVEPKTQDTFETSCTVSGQTPEGYYFVSIAVTCSDDSDTENNQGQSGEIWVGPYADLTVENVEVGAGTYAPGDTVVVYSLISNIGDRALETYATDYYLSTDNDITPTDHHIGYADRTGLAPGQQHSYETTCQLPPYLPTGDCYIGAIVTSADDGQWDNNCGHIDTAVTVVHPAGYLCGQIQYKDRPGRQHPVRYAQVEIYEGQDEPGDPEIARTHTDTNGYFGMVLPQAEGQDRPVYVKVRTKGVGGAYPGTTSTICEVRDGVLETPYFFRSLLYELPADASLAINVIIPNTDGAFAVYDSVVEGFHKARTFFGLELDPVTTYCPSPYNGSFYIPGEASIHISEDDWGDRDVILHEYGHFLAEACNFAQGEVGQYNQHYWNSDLRWTPRSHSDAQAQYFAFREAWPTLFSIATQYGDTWYPSAGDTKYQDRVIWAEWTFEIDLEKDTEAHDSPGRYFENMNCCALWDIFDDHDDLADNNDVFSDTSLAKIWTVTQACHPNDIEEFWYGWFQHFDHEEEVTRIFLDHEMPFLMMPTATGTDFETGDFSIFEWQDTSDTPWIITGEGAYEGAYCARAGAIGDSQSSTLDMTMDCQDGEISFWRKVSSEEDWDKLQFYIEGQRKGNWSGELDWEHVSYPIKAGMHRFRWIYVKSGFDSHGEDSAWIDNIEFPVQQ